MKYFFAGLCLCALLSLCSCGDHTVFTPEFIDPSDSSSALASSRPPENSSSGESSAAEESAASEESVSSEEASSEPGSTSEESSEEGTASSDDPLSEMVLTLSEDSQPLWQEDLLSCLRYTLYCSADGFDAEGGLTFDLLTLPEDHPAADSFNAYYQQDLEEWRSSVLSTVRDNALLALESGEEPQPYTVALTASAQIRGRVISVSRQGLQCMGTETVAFAAGSCFDASDGRTLSLWELFAVPQEEALRRVQEALTETAREQQQALGLQEDGWQQLAARFSPADFSCGEEGFVFYLQAAELMLHPEDGSLLAVTVPYSAFDGLLAYPLTEG